MMPYKVSQKQNFLLRRLRRKVLYLINETVSQATGKISGLAE